MVVGASALAGLAHVAPGAVAWRSMCCRLAPGLSGVGSQDHVALTFDDGPDPCSTPAFLDELDRLGWQATFFVLGSQVARSGGLTAEVLARGHEIGVHGYEHTSHLRRSAWWVTDDLRRGIDALVAATGRPPVWFRPPYGALAGSSLIAARRTGLRTVLWTCWGRDWEAAITPTAIAANVERARRPGATVLLHDSDVTSAPGSWRRSLGALPLLAERWQADGLAVGTLADHGVAGAR